MKPLAKRKMKKVLILLIIVFALMVMSYPGYSVYMAIRNNGGFGRFFDFSLFLGLFFGGLASLATLYFAFFFAERGKKAAAAIFATPWLVGGMFAMLSGIQGTAISGWSDWWMIPFWVSAGALGVIVYLFAWFSMKWKNNTLFVLGLIFTFTAVATVVGDTVMSIVRFSEFLTVNAEFFLLPAAEIAGAVLLGLTIALGVKRDDREPLFENASMFPELDAYRKSLRKERA